MPFPERITTELLFAFDKALPYRTLVFALRLLIKYYLLSLFCCYELINNLVVQLQVEFAPDLCSRVTFVNFTVTRSSLQSQCLNQVLKAERPDVDKKRSDLLKLQGIPRFVLTFVYYTSPMCYN